MAVRTFAGDHRSGSAELALRACQIFAQLVPGKTASSPEALVFCKRLAQALALSQPSMAAILNVCNRWLAAAENGSPPADAARKIAQELRQTQQAVARQAARLIPSGAAVATYSYSSSVLAALLESWNKGRRFRVFCSEGRPLLEGRVLAERLARKKIPVELFTDAAFFSAVGSSDLLLVGCDAVLSRWLVNKVGTAALLGLARRARIPSYVLADSSKFLPRPLERWFQLRPQSAREVWQTRNRNITVHNLYFEKALLRYCTGVVTEEAVHPPKAMRGLLEKILVATGLREDYPENVIREKGA
ncbi:MAG: hypothetical protein HY648_11475 [Acidobacteria bacterium]|nr:hypothetical protein [Acidobacteriota bacterium]